MLLLLLLLMASGAWTSVIYVRYDSTNLPLASLPPNMLSQCVTVCEKTKGCAGFSVLSLDCVTLSSPLPAFPSVISFARTTSALGSCPAGSKHFFSFGPGQETSSLASPTSSQMSGSTQASTLDSTTTAKQQTSGSSEQDGGLATTSRTVNGDETSDSSGSSVTRPTWLMTTRTLTEGIANTVRLTSTTTDNIQLSSGSSSQTTPTLQEPVEAHSPSTSSSVSSSTAGSTLSSSSSSLSLMLTSDSKTTSSSKSENHPSSVATSTADMASTTESVESGTATSSGSEITSSSPKMTSSEPAVTSRIAPVESTVIPTTELGSSASPHVSGERVSVTVTWDEPETTSMPTPTTESVSIERTSPTSTESAATPRLTTTTPGTSTVSTTKTASSTSASSPSTTTLTTSMPATTTTLPNALSNFSFVDVPGSNVSCYYEVRSEGRFSTNGLCAQEGSDPCKKERLVSVFGNCAGTKALTVVDSTRCVSTLMYSSTLCVPWEAMFVGKSNPTAAGNVTSSQGCPTGLAVASVCTPNPLGVTMLTGRYTDNLLGFKSGGEGIMISSCWSTAPNLQASYCPAHPGYSLPYCPQSGGYIGWLQTSAGECVGNDFFLNMGAAPCAAHSMLVSGSGGSRCIGWDSGSTTVPFHQSLTQGSSWYLWNGTLPNAMYDASIMGRLLDYEEYMALPRVLVTPLA